MRDDRETERIFVASDRERGEDLFLSRLLGSCFLGLKMIAYVEIFVVIFMGIWIKIAGSGLQISCSRSFKRELSTTGAEHILSVAGPCKVGLWLISDGNMVIAK